MRFALLLLAGCTTTAAAPRADSWPDGCFTYRDAAGKLYESDHARCARARRPYSTFKLANALIALDSGILDGPDAAMTWDHAKIPDQKGFRPEWREPQTLRSALAVSAVPHFRTLALRIGEDRMRAGLEKLHYGNRELSGGLDLFWLRGGLRISAAEQLVFVDALAHRKLDVAKTAQDVVAEISTLETKGDAVLHGKTGAGPLESGKAGWLVWQVGWIEQGRKRLPYAAWMDSTAKSLDDARAARDKRLRATLDTLGAFPSK